MLFPISSCISSLSLPASIFSKEIPYWFLSQCQCKPVFSAFFFFFSLPLIWPQISSLDLWLLSTSCAQDCISHHPSLSFQIITLQGILKSGFSIPDLGNRYEEFPHTYFLSKYFFSLLSSLNCCSHSPSLFTHFLLMLHPLAKPSYHLTAGELAKTDVDFRLPKSPHSIGRCPIYLVSHPLSKFLSCLISYHSSFLTSVTSVWLVLSSLFILL